MFAIHSPWSYVHVSLPSQPFHHTVRVRTAVPYYFIQACYESAHALPHLQLSLDLLPWAFSKVLLDYLPCTIDNTGILDSRRHFDLAVKIAFHGIF